MTHSAHQSLSGYSPTQLLVDGCWECEERKQDVSVALASLDIERFEYAWHRAAELERKGLIDGSYAELPMLRALWIIQVQLERIGWPIGAFDALKRRARIVEGLTTEQVHEGVRVLRSMGYSVSKDGREYSLPQEGK